MLQINVVSLGVLTAVTATGLIFTRLTGSAAWLIGAAAVGLVLAQAPRIAQQWERAVVLRLGRFIGLRGPGLFWIVPFVDSVARTIDQRTITTSFAAEQTLTSDTVPVNVDAVLFWMVHDAEKAALEVQDYPQAGSWAAQTALRDILGRTTLPISCADANASRTSCSDSSTSGPARGVSPCPPSRCGTSSSPGRSRTRCRARRRPRARSRHASSSARPKWRSPIRSRRRRRRTATTRQPSICAR